MRFINFSQFRPRCGIRLPIVGNCYCVWASYTYIFINHACWPIFYSISISHINPIKCRTIIIPIRSLAFRRCFHTCFFLLGFDFICQEHPFIKFLRLIFPHSLVIVIALGSFSQALRIFAPSASQCVPVIFLNCRVDIRIFIFSSRY